MNGEVIIAIIIAGEIAIVGPKYGTTLVTAQLKPELIHNLNQ